METFKSHPDEKDEHPITSLLGNLSRSPAETERIIRKSTFVIHHGGYVYAKVRSRPERGMHLMISQDDYETTVVTKEENLRHLDLVERNEDTYALIELRPAIPFHSLGFIAAISNSLAKLGLNLLVISTYSKDYLLINVRNLQTARKGLESLGLKEILQKP